ncbi:MAG: hypothetical protein R3C25_02910 [Hyphomonadaceae bacterium]
MFKKSIQRVLVVYAAAVTLVAVGASAYATSRPRNAAFDTISVRRINVVEADGTLRTVISNRANFPGTYIRGVEHPREDRPTAGMIFLDDEGSEIGGVVYGGARVIDGATESHGHMSFDQYNATQVFAVSSWEEAGERGSRLYFSDWRDRPGETGQTRLVLGRTPNRNVGLTVNDSQGRPRIRIRVLANDQPEIVMLDENGQETARLPASNLR